MEGRLKVVADWRRQDGSPASDGGEHLTYKGTQRKLGYFQLPMETQLNG
jgi:hypothetical protein